VAYASEGISQVVYRVFVFRQLERTRSARNQRLGMGIKKSVGDVREKLGRKAAASFIIVDAQSVKNIDSAEEKGYDAGKKVSGIKRYIAADTQNLPHAVAVTTADVTDRNAEFQDLKSVFSAQNSRIN
jgi:hypothetical protein